MTAFVVALAPNEASYLGPNLAVITTNKVQKVLDKRHSVIVYYNSRWPGQDSLSSKERKNLAPKQKKYKEKET